MNAMLNDYRSEKFSSNNAAAFNIFNESQADDTTVQLSAKMSNIMGKRSYHV